MLKRKPDFLLMLLLILPVVNLAQAFLEVGRGNLTTNSTFLGNATNSTASEVNWKLFNIALGSYLGVAGLTGLVGLFLLHRKFPDAVCSFDAPELLETSAFSAIFIGLLWPITWLIGLAYLCYDQCANQGRPKFSKVCSCFSWRESQRESYSLVTLNA